jgi:hypothetical protein
MDTFARSIGGTNRENLFPHQVAGEEIPPLHNPALAGGHRQQRRLAMAYGNGTRAFIENGPTEQVARVDSIRSTARSWRALTETCRLSAVEQALRAANDRIDGYPLAL